MRLKTKNKTYTFRTIIEPESEGGYHGFVPLLSGLHTQGDTIEEVNTNLQDAIKCHVEGLLMDNEDVPQEQNSFEVIHTFSSNDFSFA